MPRLKKICKSGRPKSNYSQMNDEEIREYHAEAMNKSRKSKSPAVLSHEKSPIKMSRGRPPLDKMPMSPNTLKIRKRHLGIQYYKKKKRKEKSNNAIKIRWAESSEGEGEEVGEVGEAVGEGEGGEEEECEVEQEKVEFIDKEFSKSKFYRYATRLVGMFDKNPINNLKIFLSCVPEFKHLAILPPKIDELGNMGSLSNRQLKYRKKRLINEI